MERFWKSVAKVTRTLFESRDAKGTLMPLNKLQIQNRSGIHGRQTIYDVIEMLTAASSYLIITKKEWRRGSKTEYYTLNDWGLYQTAVLNPDLREKIREYGGQPYLEVVRQVCSTDERMLEAQLNRIISMIKDGKRPSTYLLEIRLLD